MYLTDEELSNLINVITTASKTIKKLKGLVNPGQIANTGNLMVTISNLEETPLRLVRYVIEEKQKWREECDSIPFIKFPADWEIQMIPPFGDAVARFRVRLPSGREKSIYLDRRHSLGAYWEDTPYWEVYPVRGDVERCDMSDITSLLKLIADETEYQADDEKDLNQSNSTSEDQ